MSFPRAVLLAAVAFACGIAFGLAVVNLADARPRSVSTASSQNPAATSSACRTRACERRVARARGWRVCVRRHGRRACAFRSRYRDLAPARRDYIARLMACEAGRLPWDADGSGFYYRAEWDPDTWRAAGGAPVARPSLWEEAVRVHRWQARPDVGHHSTMGWPRCPR